MINKEKAESFTGKAVDFINDKTKKASDYAKEHEIEEKVTNTAEKMGDGIYNAFDKLTKKITK